MQSPAQAMPRSTAPPPHLYRWDCGVDERQGPLAPGAQDRFAPANAEAALATGPRDRRVEAGAE
jgi:hypothetical protein